MDEARRPLYAKDLPTIDWVRCGAKVMLDRAADDVARYQVYRYCSLPEAVQLFARGEWTLAHPRVWSDKFEHFVSGALFDRGPYARVSAHVKCLTLEFSSNALWKTYAGPIGVIRIGVALQDLVAMLNAAELPAGAKVYLARARYLDERHLKRIVADLLKQKPGAVANEAMRALAMKRAGFAYENELRVCLMSRARAAPLPFQTIRGLPPARIKSVQIDPYLDAWQAEELTRLLRDRLGVTAKLDQSHFNAAVAVDNPS